jgi:hypothetical protein
MDKPGIERVIQGIIQYHIDNPEWGDVGESLYELLDRDAYSDELDFAYSVFSRIRLELDPE